jgi:hypothetical protein
MRKIEFIAVFGALAMATPAMAQGRGRGNGGVPPGQRPRAGMCRIWIDGLPPGRQPAPTDCNTAAANVPYNGRIIYGDRTDGSDRRIYSSNGQVITNGQNCIRRTDQYGRVHTLCPNNSGINGINNDNDRYDRVSGVYGNRSRIYQGQSQVYRNGDRSVNGKGKAKHHKHKGDRDNDDRDRR